jgi:15-cis-phytoene synthase
MSHDAGAAGITRQSKTNFSVSFLLLPPAKHDAITTVYAFCRRTDDIVDEGEDEAVKAAQLEEWTRELEKGRRGDSVYPLLNRLQVVARRFGIPEEHFFGLIRGMRMDLETTRYPTFEALRVYCSLVASTVGLMCGEIFGHRSDSARGYAEDLGIALQLTNILRDVQSDAGRGRIYLPLEDLERFGYSEAELLASVYNDAFMRLMRFESERARAWYEKARAQLAPEDHRAFLSARIMDAVYARMLDDIERRGYDVFHGRIRVSAPVKAWLALREILRRPGRGKQAAA